MANTSRGIGALADPTRRAIFEKLAERPRAVSELAAGLPISRPAVSQHLKVLKEAGLVEDKADGARRIYRIDPHGLGEVRKWLDRFWDRAIASFAAEVDSDQRKDEIAMKDAASKRTIVPAAVRKSITVKADAKKAFEVFTAGMTRWWNPANKIGSGAFKKAILEPKVGGRWYEIDDDGSECDWGRVLVWDPPNRVLIDWQISGEWAFDPDLHTEFEVRFSPVDGGGTLVELEHRNLDRFGEAADEISSTFKSEDGFGGMLKVYRKVVEG